MEQDFTVTFADGVANQKYDLYFTGEFNGVIEVYMASGYWYSDGIGEVIQRYAFGGNSAGAAVWLNTARCIEAIGNTPNELAISGITWDATNSRWRIQIVHRTSHGNYTFLIVRAFAQDSVSQAAFNTMGVSAVYTTDTTAWPAPVVQSGVMGFASGSIPYAASDTTLTSSSNLTFDGLSIHTGGVNAGFSQAAPNQSAVITNFYLPRTADLANGWFQDYQDEFAFLGDWATSASANPAPNSGVIESVFQDDSGCIVYNSGDTISSIVLTIDCSNAPITAKGNGNYSLGLTFRSDPGVSPNPTNVLIECWDSTVSAYVTSYNAAVTLGGGYATWVSPAWAGPVNSSYQIIKCRITLTVPNPLPSAFRLQRAILYHPTCRWDTFHLWVGGGSLYGNLTLASGAQLASAGQNLVLAPAGGYNVVLSGMTFPNTNGTSGNVLTTNGSGTLSWSTALSGLTAYCTVFATSATTVTNLLGTRWRSNSRSPFPTESPIRNTTFTSRFRLEASLMA